MARKKKLKLAEQPVEDGEFKEVPKQETPAEEKKPDPLMVTPSSTLQRILNYLSTCPYNQVAEIIELIRTTAAVVPDSDASQIKQKE